MGKNNNTNSNDNRGAVIMDFGSGKMGNGDVIKHRKSKEGGLLPYKVLKQKKKKKGG